MDTPNRSHRLVSLYILNLLLVEVTGLVDLIWGVAKVFMLVSPLALFPGIPMVEFRVLLNPDLIILEGVTVWMVWLTCWGVGGIPRVWVFFLTTEALQESKR